MMNIVEYRPQASLANSQKLTLSFKTFHQGQVDDHLPVEFSSRGTVVPNNRVLYQLEKDKNDPYKSFKFPRGAPIIEPCLFHDRA